MAVKSSIPTGCLYKGRHCTGICSEWWQKSYCYISADLQTLQAPRSLFSDTRPHTCMYATQNLNMLNAVCMSGGQNNAGWPVDWIQVSCRDTSATCGVLTFILHKSKVWVIIRILYRLQTNARKVTACGPRAHVAPAAISNICSIQRPTGRSSASVQKWLMINRVTEGEPGMCRLSVEACEVVWARGEVATGRLITAEAVGANRPNKSQ